MKFRFEMFFCGCEGWRGSGLDVGERRRHGNVNHSISARGSDVSHRGLKLKFAETLESLPLMSL